MTHTTEFNEWRTELPTKVYRAYSSKIAQHVYGEPEMPGHKSGQGEDGSQEPQAGMSAGEGSSPHYWSFVVTWAVAAEDRWSTEQEKAEIIVRECLSVPPQSS